jgi:glycosyltransferase involved in cell wall biosynthesis
MAAGRPVLVLGRGEMGKLVSKTGCGLVADPGAPEAAVDAVRTLHGTPADALDAMGRLGWQAARRDYYRPDHATRMLDIFGRAVRRGGRP